MLTWKLEETLESYSTTPYPAHLYIGEDLKVKVPHKSIAVTQVQRAVHVLPLPQDLTHTKGNAPFSLTLQAPSPNPHGNSGNNVPLQHTTNRANYQIWHPAIPELLQKKFWGEIMLLPAASSPISSQRILCNSRDFTVLHMLIMAAITVPDMNTHALCKHRKHCNIFLSPTCFTAKSAILS